MNEGIQHALKKGMMIPGGVFVSGVLRTAGKKLLQSVQVLKGHFF